MLHAPGKLIQLAADQQPRVLLDALGEAEQARLNEWLAVRPDYAALVELALSLAREEPAA